MTDRDKRHPVARKGGFPAKRFSTINEAAKYEGVDYSTISKRCRDNEIISGWTWGYTTTH